jgi:hypothetical protein
MTPQDQALLINTIEQIQQETHQWKVEITFNPMDMWIVKIKPYLSPHSTVPQSFRCAFLGIALSEAYRKANEANPTPNP